MSDKKRDHGQSKPTDSEFSKSLPPGGGRELGESTRVSNTHRPPPAPAPAPPKPKPEKKE